MLRHGGWRERFGLLPASFQQTQRDALWIHAVSVGETLAIVPLVQEIQKNFPDKAIFLSHVTPAGREAGEVRLQGLRGQFYLPLDWSWSVGGALERLQPALLVIVETELWPNLLRRARQGGSRVALVNARISGRSFPRYLWARPFIRRVLENVDCICAQTSVDAERFRVLGARPERVIVTGNMKFDARPPQSGSLAATLGSALKDAGRGPIWVAASTMPGEEELLLRVWREIFRAHPRAFLILAPRHPARFDCVAALMERQEVAYVRRTLLASEAARRAAQVSSADILLLDSIGELAGIFQLANAVFIGGSLVPTGGHNLLEPAFWAKPILFGPHMDNFRDIVRLFLEGEAALEVRDAGGLARVAIELLADPERQQLLGKRARGILEQHTGATQRVLDHLRAWLEEPRPTCKAT